MIYALILIDKPQQSELRQRVRPASFAPEA